jgi:hypothetical protein
VSARAVLAQAPEAGQRRPRELSSCVPCRARLLRIVEVAEGAAPDDGVVNAPAVIEMQLEDE